MHWFVIITRKFLSFRLIYLTYILSTDQHCRCSRQSVGLGRWRWRHRWAWCPRNRVQGEWWNLARILWWYSLRPRGLLSFKGKNLNFCSFKECFLLFTLLITTTLISTSLRLAKNSWRNCNFWSQWLRPWWNRTGCQPAVCCGSETNGFQVLLNWLVLFGLIKRFKYSFRFEWRLLLSYTPFIPTKHV